MSREEIEQKIRDLKNELYFSQDVGDWRMVRAFESLISTLSSVKTIVGIAAAFSDLNTELVNIIADRQAIREVIEELEDELKEEE